MFKLKWAVFSVTFLWLVTGLSVVRAEMLCPDTVAVIEGNMASRAVLEIVEPLYRQLGCNSKFIEYPGLRGVVAFNHDQIDGELLRLRVVETSYQREYVRSSVPITTVHNTLLVHPDAQKNALPLGYQLGVLWQKGYADQHPGMLQFYSAEEVFKAYRLGHLKGFLYSHVAIDAEKTLAVVQQLPQPPLVAERLGVHEVYHYLAPEFTPFMQQLSQLLTERDAHP